MLVEEVDPWIEALEIAFAEAEDEEMARFIEFWYVDFLEYLGLP